MHTRNREIHLIWILGRANNFDRIDGYVVSRNCIGENDAGGREKVQYARKQGIRVRGRVNIYLTRGKLTGRGGERTTRTSQRLRGRDCTG